MISQMIGCMQRVCLLSEINPRGIRWFNPIDQAARWHDLLPIGSVEEMSQNLDTEVGFRSAISELLQLCRQKGMSLVLRDWSHLDFHGYPIVNSTTATLRLRDVVQGIAPLRSVITVRHPLDHFLHLKRMSILQEDWSDRRILVGIRLFAEAAQGHDWYRFEDVMEEPNAVLAKICDSLKTPFDASFSDRWWKYENITGDQTFTSPEIKCPKRLDVPNELWQVFDESEDFRQAVDLLGYDFPEELTGGSPALPMTANTPQTDDSESSIENTHKRHQETVAHKKTMPRPMNI